MFDLPFQVLLERRDLAVPLRKLLAVPFDLVTQFRDVRFPRADPRRHVAPLPAPVLDRLQVLGESGGRGSRSCVRVRR